jgi:hypothetical protein
MATSTIPEPKELELRADVDSLEVLQHRRRDLIKQWSPLNAKYGGGRGQGSPSDAARKRHRAIIMTKIETEMRQEHDKLKTRAKADPDLKIGEFKQPSEAQLERLANAHADHIAWCKDMEKEVDRYNVLDNDIKEINEKIESRLAELYCYNKELRLQ